MKKIPDNVTIRNCRPADHTDVIAVIAPWWNGRDLTHALPKLFFNHFNDGSYVAHHKDMLVAFLIGFLSPSQTNAGYIHFAGVHPSFRGKGLGACLYHKFFDYCCAHRRRVVKACTSPVNKGSVAFHTHMGFKIIPGDTIIDGVDIHSDYNRPGDSKVLFVKTII